MYRFEKTETLLGVNSNSTVGVLAAEAYQEMFQNANVDGMSLTPIGEAPMEQYYLNRVSIHVSAFLEQAKFDKNPVNFNFKLTCNKIFK